ncbi:MAG TPA: hypothetical protein VGO79_01230 [Thermoanaerobaculia bacterium]
MKRFRLFAVVSAALALMAAAAVSTAETGTSLRRLPRVVARPGMSGSVQVGQRASQAVAAGYSVQLNIVTRVVGASFYRTAVDITNNTSTDGVTASYQYCFTLNGQYQGCTTAQAILLHNFDNFHTDDIIDYMGQQGQLPPGASDASFGTFIVQFTGLPSNNGWEGTLTGRTYNAADNADPTKGTVAIAYLGSLFFESSQGTIQAIVRDTVPVSPTPDAGALRTNIGVTNTGLYNDPGTSLNFAITFYNTDTGAIVGNQLVPPHPIQVGEVFQFNDVFTAAQIPTDVTSCIAFIDITSPQGALPDTIEAYVNVLDAGTNDGAYYEFKCSVGCLSF